MGEKGEQGVEGIQGRRGKKGLFRVPDYSLNHNLSFSSPFSYALRVKSSLLERRQLRQ